MLPFTWKLNRLRAGAASYCRIPLVVSSNADEFDLNPFFEPDGPALTSTVDQVRGVLSGASHCGECFSEAALVRFKQDLLVLDMNTE